MKATLTYLDHLRQPRGTFGLDRPATVVGRGPPEVRDLPEVADQVGERGLFQVRRGDTLFVGIASDSAMARSHFRIRRAVGESGETIFLVRDLGSHSGTFVNGTHIRGAEVRLEDDDRVSCSSRFVFNLAGGTSDVPDARAGPDAAADRRGV